MRGALLVTELELRLALARPRLLALNTLVPLSLVLPIALGAAPPAHAAAVYTVLFVLFGTFGSSIPLVRDAETGLVERILGTEIRTAYYLLQRPMAGTLIDLLELAPAFGVIAWASGASPATTARAWAALAGSLLVANLLGVVVAVAARSLAETALFAAVAALVLLHASGVFRTPSPGSGWSVAEDVSPFRSLHEAMLALAGGVGIDLDPGVWLWVPGTATLIAALSPPLSRRLRTLHRNT